jgi:hypothetical protein
LRIICNCRNTTLLLCLTKRNNLIPDFDKDGNLPVGIHFSTWEEFIKRFGDSSQRQYLLQGLKKALSNLRIAGCPRIYIDGSFTTRKESPNDFDACWEVEGVNPNILDPILIEFDDLSKNLQKKVYRGDIFPAHHEERSCGKAFLDFFQIDKNTGKTKGIIAINL